VPEVRLDWCPQSAHSNVVPSRIVPTRAEVHRAQTGYHTPEQTPQPLRITKLDR
jgi:hypothetical protein